MPYTSTIVCPWDTATCELVNSVISQCEDAACILTKLKAMGLDVEGISSDVDNMLSFAKDFKATFMPKSP